jgi:hypothetical protein
MQLTESAHDVVDAFGQRLVCPFDRYRDCFPDYLDNPIGSSASLNLAVTLDELLAVNARNRRFSDTRNDCFVDPVGAMCFGMRELSVAR